jgi:S1-C subfamily serine protease
VLSASGQPFIPSTAAPSQQAHAVARGDVRPPINRLAIATMIVAVAGIPLFGLVTGPIAVILGAVAIAAIHRSRQRGVGWAAAGVLLGAVDTAGWIVALAFFATRPGPALIVADYEPDPAMLQNLSPHIHRAMMANVMVLNDTGPDTSSQRGVGSGVILRIEHGTAYVLTNRHVVDFEFSDETGIEAAGDETPTTALSVKMLGQAALPANVVWLAPGGVDLAIVSTPVISSSALPATWRQPLDLRVGDEVFAIGNPYGLGWSHTSGSVSQFRDQLKTDREIRVIQTTAAVNFGNSGGGLYNRQGELVGIITWTKDKRVSEGLGFAISLESLLELEPPFLEAPAASRP